MKINRFNVLVISYFLIHSFSTNTDTRKYKLKRMKGVEKDILKDKQSN